LAAQERENAIMSCLEYKEDIMMHMRQMELANRPKANYMRKQQDITNSMRSILVDWLVEVSEEYKLQPETLFLAVNYTDRFLSQMSVLRGKLQLVGTAAMYIASKYEEIFPPEVGDFVYITDDTYSKKQVLRMEHLLLKVLDFHLNTPTVYFFLMHYLRFMRGISASSTSSPRFSDSANNTTAGGSEASNVENMARYMSELTLIESDTFLHYLPSQIAASVLYLSVVTLGKQWTKQMADSICSGYDINELRGCMKDLLTSHQQASTHPQQAIQEKYKQPRFDSVALVEPLKSLPAIFY
jgi:cyclin A